MKRLYSVQQVCALFSIDGSTLRRWRAALSIIPLVDSSHNSRRLYTVSQIVALACAHRRFALVSSLVSSDSPDQENLDAGSLSACQKNGCDLASLLDDVDRRLRLVELHLSSLVARGSVTPGQCCDGVGQRGFCLDCGACEN